MTAIPAVHRCPLASVGLAPLLSACTGFAPMPVIFQGIGHGQSIDDAESCAHLAPTQSSRGFVAGCHHPNAAAAVHAAALVAAAPHIDWIRLLASSCSVIVTDGNGLITHWNVRASDIYGWHREAVLGHLITDIIAAPDDTALALSIMETVMTGVPWLGSFPTHTAAGAPLNIRVLNSAILGRKGKLLGIIGVALPDGDGSDAVLRHLAQQVGIMTPSGEPEAPKAKPRPSRRAAQDDTVPA